MRKYLMVLAAAAMLCGCHGKSLPEGVLDAEQMESFLVEAYQLEAYTMVMYRGNSSEPAPEVRAAYDDILRRQGVSKEDVERSMEYYSHHPAEYKEILNKVTERLNKEEK